MAARSCQRVVAIELPKKKLATMRTKLNKPDAAGILSVGMQERVVVTIGMKNYTTTKLA